MVALSKVVLEVAATEFPDWELLGAFAVFRLEEPPARARPVPLPPPTPIGRAAQDCLRQLANAFHVDFRQGSLGVMAQEARAWNLNRHGKTNWCGKRQR